MPVHPVSPYEVLASGFSAMMSALLAVGLLSFITALSGYIRCALSGSRRQVRAPQLDIHLVRVPSISRELQDPVILRLLAHEIFVFDAQPGQTSACCLQNDIILHQVRSHHLKPSTVLYMLHVQGPDPEASQLRS